MKQTKQTVQNENKVFEYVILDMFKIARFIDENTVIDKSCFSDIGKEKLHKAIWTAFYPMTDIIARKYNVWSIARSITDNISKELTLVSYIWLQTVYEEIAKHIQSKIDLEESQTSKEVRE